MKKITFLFLLSFLPLMASAYKACIDGIYYNLDSSKKTAEVTSEIRYSGNVILPSSVTYSGTIYSVTSIGDYAFYGCSELTSITIPNSVTVIGKSGFNKCSGLTNIIIPDNVTSIGAQAFLLCSSLTSVAIPNSVTSIGESAFYECSDLTSVTIGNNVTSIGDFAFYNCTSLVDVYCYAKNAPVAGGYTFGRIPAALATLHVPAASVNYYKSTDYWNGFGNIVALDEEPVVEDITINEDNFPDTNFRNWILSLDYGEDGVLTEEEISSITGISIPGLDIQNLQGIEFFTAITMLECNSNQLTSLDVSKNTALTSLSCYSNQLTYLNVSGCTALTSLYCYSNQLTLLDLSKNTALTSLYCYSNQLTSLDLSKNTALARLVCNNNQLKSLDVSKNMTLTNLYCYSNQLTSLDVSKNMALKNLYCYSNQIYGTEMDALVASLPNVSNGTMNVIYNENEGNVMTTTQVALVKAKGWTPRYYDGVFWQEYEGSEPLKCATPAIIYLNGKLMFYCETEDVKYNYSIVSSVEGSDNNITLPKSCKISVIATKEGYEPSDPFVKEIDMSYLIGKLGDINEDGKVNGTDIQEVINIIVNAE